MYVCGFCGTCNVKTKTEIFLIFKIETNGRDKELQLLLVNLVQHIILLSNITTPLIITKIKDTMKNRMAINEKVFINKSINAC